MDSRKIFTNKNPYLAFEYKNGTYSYLLSLIVSFQKLLKYTVLVTSWKFHFNCIQINLNLHLYISLILYTFLLMFQK